MNVTQNKIDDLNAIVSISVEPSDYKPQVEKALNDYRKKVNMPGFRKGKVPMGVVKKQYEGTVTFEEINKILNESLSNFISENKLSVLGQPLPVANDNLDVNADHMTFQFEIGLAPEFNVDLSKASIPYFKIEATEKEIEDTLTKMQTQFGEVVDADKIEETGHFSADVLQIDSEGQPIEEGIKTNITFITEDLKTPESFLNKKSGDTIEINAQELFKDAHQLQHFFGLSHDEAHHFNEKLQIIVDKPQTRTKAELNQDLFDKVYGKDKITSEQELRDKIKEEIENYYKKESDTKFMNDTVEWLFTNVSFDLPSEFLKKYIKNTAKEPMTDEKAATEFEKSEKALKYQLIEGKILSDNKVNVQYQDLVNYTKNQMKQQFAMYGYVDIPDNELDKYVVNAMKNEEHVRQSSGNIIQQELFKIFDNQVKKEEKKVTIEGFDKALQEEKEVHVH